MYGKILFIPDGLSCPISCTSTSRILVSNGGKGYGLTKREYLNKTQKRREVKDLFEKESCREKKIPMGLPVSRVTSYSQHVL